MNPPVDLEFQSIVGNILNKWTALKLAAECWGGSIPEINKKKQYIIEAVSSCSLSPKTEVWQDISDLLEDLIDDCFDAILEDGSNDELGLLFWELSRKWLANDKDSVRQHVHKGT